MIFLFLLLIPFIDSYKYLTINNWKIVKKLLVTDDINIKNTINTHIYNDYKLRTMKICDNYIEKRKPIINLESKLIYNAGLLGLEESINTYNSSIKYNFARYSDKYIKRNLNILYKYYDYKNKKKQFLNKFDSNHKWWNQYWIHIDNSLNPLYVEILRAKYTYDFKLKKNNYELAILYNTSSRNITEIITTSLTFIHKIIQNEYLLGEQFITNTIFF